MDSTKLHNADERLAVGQQRDVLLEPGKTRAISLGLYQSSEPEPDFTVSFSPDEEDVIGISPSRLDEDDQYVMAYMFHNYGHKPCTITVTRVERGARQ